MFKFILHLKRNIFHPDVVFTLVARVFTILCGFMTSIITARSLGPEGRGEYFLIISLTLIIIQIGNLGLQTSNTYLIAKNKELAGRLITNSVWISCLVGILSLVILKVFSHFKIFISITHPQLLWSIVILVMTNLFYLLGLNILIGLDKIKYFNYFQYVSNLIILILICLSALLHFNAIGFLWAISCGWSIIALGLYFVLLAQSTIDFRFCWKSFQTGISYSLRVYTTTILGILVLRSNLFILNMVADKTTLGYFSIASQINDTLLMIPTSLCLLLFPHLIKNEDSSWQHTRQTLTQLALVTASLCVLVALFAHPFIYFIFGSEYVSSIPIIWSILPAAFFCGLLSVISQYMAAIGLPRLHLYVWIFGFILSTALNAILIPHYLAIGSALSLSITYAALFMGVLILFYKNQNTSFSHNLIAKSSVT